MITYRTGKRRAIGYSDPTGTTAAANVDRERALSAGIDTALAADLADAYLPPVDDPEWHLHIARDETGARTGIAPDIEVGPYGIAADRPLTNAEAAHIIAQLAHLPAWRAA